MDVIQPCVLVSLIPLSDLAILSNSEPATYTYVAECACRWRSSAAGRQDSHVVCNFSSGR